MTNRPTRPTSRDLYGSRELTRKEVQVVKLAVRGLTATEIGTELGISEGAAKAHIRRIYDKVGMWSRLELALWWLKGGGK